MSSVTSPIPCSTGCWGVCETGIEQAESQTLQPNRVVRVDKVSSTVFNVFLERPISAGHWTTITYLGANGAPGASATYASLPANVNGDSGVSAVDQLDLIDCLNGQMQWCPYGIYSTDLDHSGLFAPADYLTLLDLFNGAGTFIPWYGQSLPTTNSCLGGAMMAGGGSSLGESATDELLDAESENALVADWFVEYLAKANPIGSQEIEDFNIIVDGLTQWCVDHFTADEKKALAERLSDPTLTFAGDAGAKSAAGVIESLRK